MAEIDEQLGKIRCLQLMGDLRACLCLLSGAHKLIPFLVIFPPYSILQPVPSVLHLWKIL